VGLVTSVALGPVTLLLWTAEQILEVAENELYDEDAVRAALVQLNDDFDRGRLTEPEFLAAEDVLMERLTAARDRSAT
jgi:hypothetical protein